MFVFPCSNVSMTVPQACMSPDPASRPTFQQLASVLKASLVAWRKLDAGPGGPGVLLPPAADGCNDGVCLRPTSRPASRSPSGVNLAPEARAA